MARNYVKGSGKTGRVNGKLMQRDEAKFYLGVKVTVIPENKDGLTGRHNERRVTARPAELPWIDVESIGANDQSLLAVTGDDRVWANTDPIREIDSADQWAMVAENGYVDAMLAETESCARWYDALPCRKC